MRNKISLDDPNYDQNQRGFKPEQQVVVQDHAAIKLWMIIGVLAVIFVSALAIMVLCSGDDSSSPDPNRTEESCTRFGTADVFPAMHCNGNCYEDADGYYYPTFGHHHHK